MIERQINFLYQKPGKKGMKKRGASNSRSKWIPFVKVWRKFQRAEEIQAGKTCLEPLFPSSHSDVSSLVVPTGIEPVFSA